MDGEEWEKPRGTGSKRASQEGSYPDVNSQTGWCGQKTTGRPDISVEGARRWEEHSLQWQPHHLPGCVTLSQLSKLSKPPF